MACLLGLPKTQTSPENGGWAAEATGKARMSGGLHPPGSPSRSRDGVGSGAQCNGAAERNARLAGGRDGPSRKRRPPPVSPGEASMTPPRERRPQRGAKPREAPAISTARPRRKTRWRRRRRAVRARGQSRARRQIALGVAKTVLDDPSSNGAQFRRGLSASPALAASAVGTEIAISR